MVILFAEDDVQLQYFIWKLLRADGFIVMGAISGEAALEISRRYSGPVDLLLTDLEMPGMSGLELYRLLAVERPGIKVLIMSGGVTAGEGTSITGLPFLQKPFTPSGLHDAIAALLAETCVATRTTDPRR